MKEGKKQHACSREHEINLIKSDGFASSSGYYTQCVNTEWTKRLLKICLYHTAFDDNSKLQAEKWG